MLSIIITRCPPPQTMLIPRRYSPVALAACEARFCMSDLYTCVTLGAARLGPVVHWRVVRLQMQGFGSALLLPQCTAAVGNLEVEPQLLARL